MRCLMVSGLIAPYLFRRIGNWAIGNRELGIRNSDTAMILKNTESTSAQQTVHRDIKLIKKI